MGPDLVRHGAGRRRPPARRRGDGGAGAQRRRTAGRRPPVGSRCAAGDSLDDDPDVLLEAVAVHRHGPRPYQLAVACEDAGVALGRIGKASEAESLLDEAVAVYERLDAVRDVDRVQPALRGLGVRRPRRAARRPAVRMGQPHPDRAAGRGPRRHGAHQPGDRSSGCSCHAAPSRPTSSTCSRSSVMPTGSSSPPTPPAEQLPTR